MTFLFGLLMAKASMSDSVDFMRSMAQAFILGKTIFASITRRVGTVMVAVGDLLSVSGAAYHYLKGVEQSVFYEPGALVYCGVEIVGMLVILNILSSASGTPSKKR